MSRDTLGCVRPRGNWPIGVNSDAAAAEKTRPSGVENAYLTPLLDARDARQRGSDEPPRVLTHSFPGRFLPPWRREQMAADVTPVPLVWQMVLPRHFMETERLQSVAPWATNWGFGKCTFHSTALIKLDAIHRAVRNARILWNATGDDPRTSGWRGKNGELPSDAPVSCHDSQRASECAAFPGMRYRVKRDRQRKPTAPSRRRWSSPLVASVRWRSERPSEHTGRSAP